MTETFLAILAGSVLGPILTALVKRVPWIDSELGAALNLGLTVALYLGAWGLWTGGDRAQLEQWLTWALAAAGVGGAGNNVWRKRMAHQP